MLEKSKIVNLVTKDQIQCLTFVRKAFENGKFCKCVIHVKSQVQDKEDKLKSVNLVNQ